MPEKELKLVVAMLYTQTDLTLSCLVQKHSGFVRQMQSVERLWNIITSYVEECLKERDATKGAKTRSKFSVAKRKPSN